MSKRQQFRQAYEGQPPWDIPTVQPVFAELADQIEGSILEPGCGTGENVLFFAQRGHDATGVDFVERPIVLARQKAAQRGVTAHFQVLDALRLEQLGRHYDHVLDCGLFHVLDDADRSAYVQSLARVQMPGSRLWLLCFSDQQPPGPGPRRISREEIQAAFATGWQVQSITAARFQPAEHAAAEYGEHGPRAYLAAIDRL